MLPFEEKNEIGWVKNLAFAIGLFFFIYVISAIFYFHNMRENLFYLLLFIAINAAILLLSPRIMPENIVIKSYREGMHAFFQALNSVVSAIALIFVYLFGVGFVWLLSRLSGKRFLETKHSKESDWIRRENKRIDVEEMF